MKQFLVSAKKGGSLARASKIGFSLLAGVALAMAFWAVATPGAVGANATPAELIQSKLPSNMTIANASDAKLLEAVCGAIKQSPKEAALIVRTAGGARPNLRSDILCMGVRCTRQARSLDCKWVVDVVKEWIKTDPALANQLTESVSAC